MHADIVVVVARRACIGRSIIATDGAGAADDVD